MPEKVNTIQKHKTILGFLAICVVLIIFALFHGGCEPAGKVKSGGKKLKIGLLITSRGLGDQGFNDLAYSGLKSVEQKYGVQAVVIEPSTLSDHEASLRFFAGQSFDAIIAVGTAFHDSIKVIAKEHQDLKLFVIDSDIREGNIIGICFREDEGSFLCGYLAAKVSKTGKIGFLGGVKIPVTDRFLVGYINGARYARKDIEIDVRYVAEDFTGFNLAEKASDIASQMYNSDCDVIYPPAGASALGVIAAAVKHRKFVIGIDMNQDSKAPGLVLTSMQKKVDAVVEDIVKNLKDGKTADKMRVSYGISDGGIALTEFQFSHKVLGEPLIKEVSALNRAIVDGKIKTNTPVDIK